MFALVIYVCYLQGGCEDYVIDVLKTEQQCLAAMDEQHIRRGGCYPYEEVGSPFWIPAYQH